MPLAKQVAPLPARTCCGYCLTDESLAQTGARSASEGTIAIVTGAPASNTSHFVDRSARQPASYAATPRAPRTSSLARRNDCSRPRVFDLERGLVGDIRIDVPICACKRRATKLHSIRPNRRERCLSASLRQAVPASAVPRSLTAVPEGPRVDFPRDAP